MIDSHGIGPPGQPTSGVRVKWADRSRHARPESKNACRNFTSGRPPGTGRVSLGTGRVPDLLKLTAQAPSARVRLGDPLLHVQSALGHSGLVLSSTAQ
jgi:hypothetical protein